MTHYALFRDGQQISKAHTTRDAVVIEAFELAVVGQYHRDMFGDRPTYTALLPGYEIRPVADHPCARAP